jgi:SlyX protein
MTMDERVTELEIRFMQQEKTILELNDAVYRQELVLERLQREMTVMREQLTTASPSINRTMEEEEPPPHY